MLHRPVESTVKSGKSQSEQKFSALHQKAVTYARASSTGGGKAGGVVGVFEKGEEIVFGPDGGLERDMGKDQEIVASALAHGRGGSPDWLLRPMDCLAGALRSGAAIADHMQARRPATISRLSAAPMRHPIRLWT